MPVRSSTSRRLPPTGSSAPAPPSTPNKPPRARRLLPEPRASRAPSTYSLRLRKRGPAIISTAVAGSRTAQHLLLHGGERLQVSTRNGRSEEHTSELQSLRH